MYCDLLAGLLGTVIVTLYIYLKKNVWSNFIKKLDKQELIAYNRIKRTRIWILFASFIFSLIATYGLSYLFNVHLLSIMDIKLHLFGQQPIVVHLYLFY